MPRNEIAAIIGLIVALWYVFAGRTEALPRSRRALGGALIAFLVAFAITWIALRLFDY